MDEEMTKEEHLERLSSENADLRKLAGLRDLDPPDVTTVLAATLILKGPEQRALQALIRNIQRLEDSLDESRTLCDQLYDAFWDGTGERAKRAAVAYEQRSWK